MKAYLTPINWAPVVQKEIEMQGDKKFHQVHSNIQNSEKIGILMKIFHQVHSNILISDYQKKYTLISEKLCMSI